MNYLFTGPTIAFTVGDRVQLEMVKGRDYEAFPALSAAEYAEKMEELLNLYPWEIQLTQLNLLASHDTARLISIAGGDITSVELATLLLLTFPGSPSIYYGDEVGLPGGLDPDCRRGFPTTDKWNLEILKTHKQLISLRHQYPALRIGDYQVIYADTTLYVFVRTWKNQELMIAVNIGEESVKASIDSSKLTNKLSKLLYGKGEIFWSEKNIEVNIPPRSGDFVILRFSRVVNL
jgi:cyclomaltodextrinase